jgi:hypothetical protein
MVEVVVELVDVVVELSSVVEVVEVPSVHISWFVLSLHAAMTSLEHSERSLPESSPHTSAMRSLQLFLPHGGGSARTVDDRLAAATSTVRIFDEVFPCICPPSAALWPAEGGSAIIRTGESTARIVGSGGFVAHSALQSANQRYVAGAPAIRGQAFIEGIA